MIRQDLYGSISSAVDDTASHDLPVGQFVQRPRGVVPYMDPQVIVGLTASLFGGAIVAIISYVTNRKKTAAEVRKIDAEAEKVKAETQKVLKEIGTVVTSPPTRSDDAAPKGWYLAGSHPDDYTIGVDREVAYVGNASGYIEGNAEARSFGTLMQTFKADAFRGQRRRLSAFVRVEKSVGYAALWMRVDGPDDETQSFDNMNDRPIKGNTGWKNYCIVLDIPPDAKHIAFGIILNGSGRAWIDNVRFDEVDETDPVTGQRELPSGPANTDFEE